MIKSLYTRVVLTFLASVIGGTIIAFFIATWIFEDKLNNFSNFSTLHFTQDIVRLYESFPLDEANSYINGMKQLASYHVRIYDNTGEVQSFGAIKGDKPSEVTMENITKAINGEIVQLDPKGLASLLIGLPLGTEAERKAIFVQPKVTSTAQFAVKWIIFFLTYSLLVGSLMILVAAMFLVRPIKKLTKATRRIAAGDFNVKLNIKQTGELGALARSFEGMMHDLQHLEGMRREFVANVSHEVQSPLTSISGYAVALKQMDISDDTRSRYLDIIITEADRMSKMSDSLLKLSLLESHSQKLQLTTFSLDEQIRRVIVAIQPLWLARNIRFELNLKNVSLLADYDQLNQVWMNILGNSIKFSTDDSIISISIKQDIKNVTVRISDTGVGISLDDQKRIFERFFKADRSHSRKYGGSGMGLAIVKQIVTLHNGDIRVESELGQGTTIIVILPITTSIE
ncbi:cell wall metabolism sensor histidine kinase WalK [Paenibacillus sp. L3-i20]|uniref:sensor histidine kinase n=1 Tax=Paenibacillus sp. L3-i20 TaxID=2905833 RepID=UPI001EDCE74E|nr:HAMP domain-containing sensor histidine kinase [Paenibacillus sp. L3-i20]GKU78836.1 two-component sensor histidine kinase [Paenibacillus sp. L3-i20]